jgi:hypothetical protein
MVRVEVDLNNGGKGEDGAGITYLTHGNLGAVEAAGIELVAGLEVLLADYDGFDDGSPAWLEVQATVERCGDSWIARWNWDSRRWVPRDV